MEEYIDSRDFVEDVIKHLIRDKRCYNKAKELGVTADLFGDAETGIRVYREFVNIVMEIDDSPISWTIFTGHYNNKIENGKLDAAQEDKYLEYILSIYDGELNSEYILRNLPEFVKRRKTKQLQYKFENNPEDFVKEYSKLAIQIKMNSSGSGPVKRLISPMDIYTPPSFASVIPTGFTSIDENIYGLGFQEFGLIMGASGGGKSTLATVLARNAAGLGKKVLYITLEEAGVNIRDRLLSSLLDLAYSNLHTGMIEARLVQERIDSFPRKQMYLDNIKILDLKNESPITAKDLAGIVDKECEESGFRPDLVIIDQLDYMDSTLKFSNEWQKYQQVVFDLDIFSNSLICGVKPFGMYLLHQLKGKMQLDYTVDDIASYRGVIKPVDNAFAIGREKPDSNLVKITSLKVRHNKNFNCFFKANFENMNLIELPKGTRPFAKVEIKKNNNRKRLSL